MVRTNTLEPARHGRGRRARQGHRPRARDVGRRQRPLLLSRPVSRRDARGRRGGAQRRVRGRAAARRDQLPELRQPRAARRSCGSSRRPSRASATACRALDVPITGGNVSLYNETDGRAIYPTPVIGVVGLLEHADRVRRPAVPRRGRRDRAARRGRGELGGSEYLKVVHGLVRGVPPALDLAARARAAGAARRRWPTARLHALRARLLGRRPGRDAGRVLRSTPAASASRRRSTPSSVARDAASTDAAALFGESASRVVVSVAPGDVTTVLERGGARPGCRRASSAGPAARGCAIAVAGDAWRSTCRWPTRRRVDGRRRIETASLRASRLPEP